MKGNWLDSIYSDGTTNFVSDQTPDIGDQVEITIRFLADAPVKHVMLHSFPNGGERYYEAKKVKEVNGLAYYAAKLPINEYRIQYNFVLVTDEQLFFYTQKGVTTYIPDHTYDFVLLTDYHQPDWIKGAVMYQIFPERFANGKPEIDVQDGEYEYMGYKSIHMDSWYDKPLTYEEGHGVDFFGGDLYGIKQKLPYLKDLGVTVLYLNPIFASYSTHKYDCTDYFHVDKHFGGDEALAELCDAVHNEGMKIILDISVNHTGILHSWAQEKKPYYFKNPDGSLQGWWGFETLPVLDYRNEELRDLVYRKEDSVLRKWLKPPYSIDGWRFDVADVFARNNEVQLADEVWKEICEAIREENPDAYIVGEDWGDCAKYLQGHRWNTPMNYFGFGRIIRQYCGLNDFFLERQPEFRNLSYRTTAEDIVGRVEEHYAKIPQVMADCQMNLFDSHDLPRLHNYEQIDFDKWKCAVTGQLLWTGIPCIYYGDEVAIDGYTWHDAGFRYPMPWDRTTPEGERHMAVIKKMTELRRNVDAFSMGSRQVVYTEGRIIAIARFAGDDIYVGVMSMEDEDKTIELPLYNIGASAPVSDTDVFGEPVVTEGFDSGVLKLRVPAGKGLLFSCS